MHTPRNNAKKAILDYIKGSSDRFFLEAMIIQSEARIKQIEARK